MVSSQISHPSHFVNAELLNSLYFPRLFKYWDKHPPSLCEAVSQLTMDGRGLQMCALVKRAGKHWTTDSTDA